MKLLIDIPEHVYEHAKEESEDSRDEFEAMRAIANGSQQESCGDAISREAAVNAIYDLCGENVSLKENPLRDNPHMDAVVDALENLPSVTPQQRTGMWEFVRYDGLMGNWHCSECRTIIPHMPEETDNTPIYKWCPMCGAKMEVEE